MEIVEKCCVGLFHGWNQTVLQAVEVILVRVPDDAGPVDGGDEAGSGFDESACEQVALSPRMSAVLFANFVGFLGEVERVGCLPAGEQVTGFFSEGVVFLDGVGGEGCGETFDLSEEGDAFLESG